MPTPRRHVQAGLVKQTDGTRQIVVAGGRYLASTSNVTEILDLQTLEWSTGDDLPDDINSGASVPFNDSFLIVGGLDADNPPVKSIYYFNPQDQKWESKNKMMKN